MTNRSLKTVVLIGLVPLILALLYTGWTFYARSQENQQMKREAQVKEAEDARKFLSVYGADEVKITQFYVSPAAVGRGEKANLCYGVLNANAVKMEPAVDNVYPALTHCVQVAPVRTATYRLIADGKNGKQVTE